MCVNHTWSKKAPAQQQKPTLTHHKLKLQWHQHHNLSSCGTTACASAQRVHPSRIWY